MSRIIPLPRIATRVLVFRGHRVLLASDLAELYQVAPKALTQAVKRNRSRFPDDFMFQLNREVLARVPGTAGADRSRSQSVTLKRGANVKYLPHAFTEQGVAMLSSVLRSKRAIDVNIEIMRAFVRLREIVATNRDIAKKMAELETNQDMKFAEYDGHLKVVFEAINQLLAPEAAPSRKVLGFTVPKKSGVT